MIGHATAPSRGEVTRESILAAAMEVFARDGFRAASTRAIARAANANQALIGYHFGNKQRLYLTVFEHIADRVETLLGPTLARIESELAPPVDGDPANARLLLDLVSGFAAMLLSDETSTWARLILNEQQRPSEAFDVLYQRVIGRVARLLTQLVARLRGRTDVTEEDRLIAITIIGQVLVFRVAHAAVLRQFGWNDIGPRQVGAIIERLQANIAAILAIDIEQLAS